MPQVLRDDRLNRLAKAANKQIKDWEEGVSLQNDSGQTISQLISNAAADRWRFAYEHRHNANKLLRSKPPLYRSAISRYYYSMYHAIRACVFVSHGGDDHQEHRELPLYIPRDFPPEPNWQNMLRNARVLRNRADYEPYPKSNIAWKQDAFDLKTDADLFLSTARAYLQTKGCIL
jgi:uncharacterized protein (UPF0332 family)